MITILINLDIMEIIPLKIVVKSRIYKHLLLNNNSNIT